MIDSGASIGNMCLRNVKIAKRISLVIMTNKTFYSGSNSFLVLKTHLYWCGEQFGMKLYENHGKNKEINGKLIQDSVKFSWKRWQWEKIKIYCLFFCL